MVKFLQRKYLISVLGILVVLFVLVFAREMFFKEKAERVILPPLKIEIDFGILESQEVQELEPFEKIEYFEEEIGRENPFLPY